MVNKWEMSSLLVMEYMETPRLDTHSVVQLNFGSLMMVIALAHGEAWLSRL